VRACVIFNPTARGDKARRFRTQLDEIASRSALKLTQAAGDARRLAAEAVMEGFDTIVAAGGDGTVNEVLNGIADAPQGLENARLAVMPLGTVNVFARELGLPFSPSVAWERILAGTEIQIDLPRAEFQLQGRTTSRYFTQLGGAGLDAQAVELVNWPLKKRIGPLAYVWAGLKALTGRPCQITVSGGGSTARGELVLIGNGTLYGGNYRLFPKADLRDGLLDVCVFPRVNWLTLARCGPELVLRGRLPGAATVNFTAPSLTLEAAGPAPMELDGELVGHLPATFTLERTRLRVVT
jgi:YegS/Rv2252/BmrU family lipid kinase